ncbi:ankyrin repeat-containing protein ITN1-like isoform X1 [Papaver somniferum]|uniref:ankyrin repeat-containing protein ITN1-like isoform X1 n=1 Tax=Papaver somniferum TaxID=3469 RepID=UPI000E6FD819|nr:ankyrin repeat-containing protein ITN1-like isoform X1 [Papaver somniferum]
MPSNQRQFLGFSQVITWKNDYLDISGLELIIQRPFVFLSGAKLTWWQRYIYSLIQVDIDSTYNAVHQAFEVKESLLLSTLRYLRGEDTDEENPSIFVRAEAIKESKQKDSLKVSSTSDKGMITSMFFSVNSFLARIQDAFVSIDRMSYLTQVPHVKELYNKKLMHKQASALVKQMLSQLKRTMDQDQLRAYFNNDTNVMQTAMKHGTVEFVAECLKKFPFMLWSGFNGKKMIPMAIIERNEIILTLLCEANMNTPMKNQLLSYRDEKGNTILHHAAKLASSFQLNLISGLALQMLREIQEFKWVEIIIPEEDKFRRNRSGDTAQYIFTEEHKDLLEKAEKWMKDTSGSCMVVAALIPTVAFAAVFTVPGGNISDSNSSKNGTPVFLGKPLFTIFALALFSSITSVLIFLAIYTSRYAEEDFLKSLPQKLIIGLATLFISMATIVIAFGVTLFMVLRDRLPWSIIPIVLFSCVPVTLFAWLQLPLFVEMVQSTYWGGSLFQKYRYVKPIKKSDQKKKEN